MKFNSRFVVFGLFLLLVGVLAGIFVVKNNVLNFAGPQYSTTLQSLTGVLIDKDKKPIVGADMIVGILEKEGEVINPIGENKLSFGEGEPQQGDCVLRDKTKYKWFEEFASATNNDGRVDLMLGSTKELRLKMNGRYLMEIRFKRKGSNEWKIIDLNPSIEDAEDETTCAQEFQSTNGPGEGEITSIEIGDKQVGNTEIADGAVTSDKIADAAVRGVDIASNAVTAEKINVESVYRAAIQENVIVNDLVDANADIAYTKIESDAPWFNGVCLVQVIEDLSLDGFNKDWTTVGSYVGGTTRVYAAVDGSASWYEERMEGNPSEPFVFKNGVKLAVSESKKYKLNLEDKSFVSCWADSGVAPTCYKSYASMSACESAADLGRCTALEATDDCDEFGQTKPWIEFKTPKKACTEVTIPGGYYRHLRVSCS